MLAAVQNSAAQDDKAKEVEAEEGAQARRRRAGAAGRPRCAYVVVEREPASGPCVDVIRRIESITEDLPLANELAIARFRDLWLTSLEAAAAADASGDRVQHREEQPGTVAKVQWRLNDGGRLHVGIILPGGGAPVCVWVEAHPVVPTLGAELSGVAEVGKTSPPTDAFLTYKCI